MALKSFCDIIWLFTNLAARSYSFLAVSYAIRVRFTGSPSGIFSAEIFRMGAPLLTLIPSVTGWRKETTPATLATTTLSSPCAACTCPLVVITWRNDLGWIISDSTPAAFAFSGARIISSECPAAISASWLCPSWFSLAWSCSSCSWSWPSWSWLCAFSVSWLCPSWSCSDLLLQEPKRNNPKTPIKISFFMMI